MSPSVQISAVPDVPDIAPGDDLGEILGRCLATSLGAEDGDILCVAHKVISKAEGNLVDMDQVTPSDEATELATRLNKRPEKVEVILNQSVRVVR
ncbi:MAG: coenzyme F420-0:L-glutamate ligase, partial [Pseudomonadota bacterium]